MSAQTRSNPAGVPVGSDRVHAAEHRIAIVVPSYLEDEELMATYERLSQIRGIAGSVIADSTPQSAQGRQVAEGLHARSQSDTAGVTVLLDAPRGRALQQNAGAAACPESANVLLFVHADSQLPEGVVEKITSVLNAGPRWGRFDITLDAKGSVYRMVETAMNLRSRLSGICTGDQCLFIERELFDAIGGFPEQSLMEDVEISVRLKRAAGAPGVVSERVTTSARRWQRDGPLRTIVLMWRLRLMYALGASPDRLSALYANTRRRA